MPTVIDWNTTVDPSELVRRAREELTAGRPVVLPGDNGYLAFWPASLDLALPGAALLTWGPDEATARGLELPTAARRLMFRAWPAPLVLEVPAGQQVPTSANGFARLRCPDHPLTELVTQATRDLSPLLVADLGCATAEDASGRVGAAAELVANAGPLAPTAPPTVVRVTPSGYDVLEPGAFPRDEVERLSARIILFVCTGNTCRSPLAESIGKKLLTERLGCAVAELPARGFWLLSAGVATYGGGPASDESCAVAAEFGADLSAHASRPVNPQLLLAADHVLTMTRGHLLALEARYPGVGPVPELLCGDEDLNDPIGYGLDVYRDCARAVARHLERHIPEWVQS